MFYTPYSREEVILMNTVIKDLGKAVIVEGTKAVLFGAGVAAIVALATTGPKGIKELSLTDLLK